MDRNYFPNHLSLEAKVVILHLRATIGASGAVTLDAVNSKGITSIAKSATGRYLVTLNDYHTALLGAPNLAIETTSVTAADGHQAVLRSEAVASAKTITISTLETGTSTEANPASGAVLRATLSLKATSV
jgi:hypothetical protein